MNILITICARGGSKGIPGKNIKLLNGKPLIYFSLSTATKFAELIGNVDVVLSTDDQEIKTAVESFGFNIDTGYLRPEFLASDTAGKIDAIHDVFKYAAQKNNQQYDYVIDLDVTSPLRTVSDLQQAFEALKCNEKAYNIFSVSPANRNPYFNMVEEQADGFFSTCKKGAFLTRQSAPKVYDMNASFYIYKAKFFSEGLKTAITEWSLVYEVPHLCFDLDHPIDFVMMAFLMENGHLDFEL
ncbi:N-acylneuraminate cytidylyltransferase/CMP-N,N'-diacetyllegionaminic acid synthase [Pedobacter steynii]|uniref:N-acylneuraminate cytidylyltransferase/CMP-N,N'-diacetyllegionaminic acid synthase n=1 Tax=Pedobacter steynii TaxID=430522 RepID=A0A1G9WGC6_9SPHI|nr:acylneuraminate cytidylyltransferase family protein [Pedobacter steynii]NQX40284.1 acylneuraminate cytidylyltransferase family protein [Pedobacter steynii]SDM83313.1 N-acylneuraminate cytidylyltransferase/CMP-N,N'-diacetyllegionaminic acid synthase [Pedobacter steynii]